MMFAADASKVIGGRVELLASGPAAIFAKVATPGCARGQMVRQDSARYLDRVEAAAASSNDHLK